MKVGAMRHRIEIQQYIGVENELGEIAKEWTTFTNVWAEKKQVRSSNTNDNDKEGIEYTYRFKVRYREDLDESMRILHKGIVYDIKHINPIHELSLFETHIDCIHHKEGVYNE